MRFFRTATWSNARAHPLHVLSPCGVFHLSLPVTAHSEQFPALLLGPAALHVAHCMFSTAKFWGNVNVSQCKHPTCWLSTVHCALHTKQSSAKVQYQRSFWAIPASAANAVQGLAQQCSANQWNARFRWQSLQCKLFESDTLQSILALSANGSSFQMDHLLQSEAIASHQPPGT